MLRHLSLGFEVLAVKACYSYRQVILNVVVSPKDTSAMTPP